MKITIYGQVPALKNSKSIAYNRGTKKPFIMSNKRVQDWKVDALLQLKSVIEKFHMPVKINYLFYVKDNRPRDVDNMVCSVNDLLQEANSDYMLMQGKTKRIKGTGIIKDDSWQFLEIGSARARIDKNEPRCELDITPLKNTAHNVDNVDSKRL